MALGPAETKVASRRQLRSADAADRSPTNASTALRRATGDPGAFDLPLIVAAAKFDSDSRPHHPQHRPVRRERARRRPSSRSAKASFAHDEGRWRMLNGHGFAGPKTVRRCSSTCRWFEARSRTVAGGDDTVSVAEVVSAGVRDAEHSARAALDRSSHVADRSRCTRKTALGATDLVDMDVASTRRASRPRRVAAAPASPRTHSSSSRPVAVCVVGSSSCSVTGGSACRVVQPLAGRSASVSRRDRRAGRVDHGSSSSTSTCLGVSPPRTTLSLLAMTSTPVPSR